MLAFPCSPSLPNSHRHATVGAVWVRFHLLTGGLSLGGRGRTTTGTPPEPNEGEAGAVRPLGRTKPRTVGLLKEKHLSTPACPVCPSLCGSFCRHLTWPPPPPHASTLSDVTARTCRAHRSVPTVAWAAAGDRSNWGPQSWTGAHGGCGPPAPVRGGDTEPTLELP